MYTESTMQYIARDYDVLTAYRDLEKFRNVIYERMVSGQFVDQYLYSMLDHKARLERKVQDVNAAILKISTERAQQGTASYAATLVSGGKSLDEQYDLYLDYKESILEELENINSAITKYQGNLFGWNGQSQGSDVDRFNSIKQANLSDI